jgi:hypothetical protein
LTAVNSTTGNQVTKYVYGTTLTDSAIATSTLKRAEIYPDSDDVSSPLGDGTDTREVKGSGVFVLDASRLGKRLSLPANSSNTFFQEDLRRLLGGRMARL